MKFVSTLGHSLIKFKDVEYFPKQLTPLLLRWSVKN